MQTDKKIITFTEQHVKDFKNYKHSYVDDIDTYFAKKGIRVVYNTLMGSEILARSFVKDYQHMVDRAYSRHFKFIKNDVYQTMYPIVSRKKLTGFEGIKKWDLKKRAYLNEIVPIRNRMFPLSSLGVTQTISENKWVQKASFKEQLKLSVRGYENPLLYLSGGGDSELVAYSLLDAGVKFKVVICKFILDDGSCANYDDIKYAFAFCKKENIIPIVKEIKISEAWNDSLFDEIACGTYSRSPQIATHAYMVEMLNAEYPNHTHLFGGEIRFHSCSKFDWEKGAPWHNTIYFAKIPGVLGHYTATRTSAGSGFGTTYASVRFAYSGVFGVLLVPGGSQSITYDPAPAGTIAGQTNGNYTINNSGTGNSQAYPDSPFTPSWSISDASVLANVSGATIARYWGLEIYYAESPGVTAAEGHSLEVVNAF